MPCISPCAAYHGPSGRQTEVGLVVPEVQGCRRWIGLLLVAVVGSLLTVAAAPAAAVKGVVDHPAEYSACVGPAEAPANLPDVKGGFAEWAVNCIFYYGITKGTGAGLFAADDAVTRWQMALFLRRAAGSGRDRGAQSVRSGIYRPGPVEARGPRCHQPVGGAGHHARRVLDVRSLRARVPGGHGNDAVRIPEGRAHGTGRIGYR